MIFQYSDGLIEIDIDIGEVEHPPERGVEA